MDNNNMNINPEIVPDAPDAVIPEINTIEPINEIAETAVNETAAAAEVTVAAVEDTVVAAAEETVAAVEETAVAAEETVAAAVEDTVAATDEVDVAETPELKGEPVPVQSEPVVTEAFPAGSAPVVYATGNNSQPTYAPYYAADDNYTQRSETGEGFALTSFILGLGSLVLAWGTPLCYVCIALAVAGIIFASVARKKGAVNSLQKSGLTMAIIGLILSVITSVSCTVCNACSENLNEMAASGIFSELEEGDFETLQQFVEQYGSSEDLEEFNEALEQLQGMYSSQGE